MVVAMVEREPFNNFWVMEWLNKSSLVLLRYFLIFYFLIISFLILSGRYLTFQVSFVSSYCWFTAAGCSTLGAVFSSFGFYQAASTIYWVAQTIYRAGATFYRAVSTLYRAPRASLHLESEFNLTGVRLKSCGGVWSSRLSTRIGVSSGHWRLENAFYLSHFGFYWAGVTFYQAGATFYWAFSNDLSSRFNDLSCPAVCQDEEDLFFKCVSLLYLLRKMCLILILFSGIWAFEQQQQSVREKGTESSIITQSIIGSLSIPPLYH